MFSRKSSILTTPYVRRVFVVLVAAILVQALFLEFIQQDAYATYAVVGVFLVPVVAIALLAYLTWRALHDENYFARLALTALGAGSGVFVVGYTIFSMANDIFSPRPVVLGILGIVVSFILTAFAEDE